MTELVYLKDVTRMSNTVLTVGTFDGVHEGHKSLISKVVGRAKDRDARSVIVTFDPHPREIIDPGTKGINLLTTLEERREILSDLGVDILLVIPFDRDFSLLTSEQFIRKIIWNKIGVSEFIIGYDHQFGRNREGTISTVKEIGKEYGFDVQVVQAHEIEKVTVSSSSVRKALESKGDVTLARNFLGRPYAINATVVHGDKRGKKIGFPTANLKPELKRKIIPANGVYAVDVLIEKTTYRGMMNIGVRPTFDSEMSRTLEVNIFDFDEEIYGKSIRVLFLKRIRDEKKFDGVDALITQLELDKQHCLNVE